MNVEKTKIMRFRKGGGERKGRIGDGKEKG